MVRSCTRLRVSALAGMALSLFSLPAAAASWRGKVDPWVLETAGPARATEFLVFLREQADLSGSNSLAGKAQKGHFVYEQLTETARRTQAPILAELRALGAEHRSFWAANMIWVRGDIALVERMAERADVARVSANPAVRLELPVAESRDLAAPVAIEPNITHTGAPAEFWDNGFTGQGFVVGGADTGYDWDHPALRDHYRGWDGDSADHNYNWHDSIHSGGGSCGPDSPEPCDDNSHGTHTMGTMVGDDGGSNQIGMAPGARWMGCRNMNQGVGTPATYTECFEFFIAPTNLDGENPDPSRSPHAINNSWSCPGFEGCTDPNVLKTVVENTRAAGILVVVSAGNSGPGCSTVNTPAAIYDASFTVGSTNNADLISGFSSRGQVTVDGSNRLKPDISAPGENVRSSFPGVGYGFLSGTSMAGPHVAGLAALVLSAAPCLEGEVNAIEAYIRNTALPRTTSQICGDVPGDEVPNNTYGWGAIRAVLPTDVCALPMGGMVAGVSGMTAACRDFDNDEQVIIPLDGSRAWNCSEAGFPVVPGARVGQLARGRATGGPIGGRVMGMTGQVAVCRNLTTGQRVQIPLGGDRSWNCTAAGLQASPGQRVTQQVRGTAG